MKRLRLLVFIISVVSLLNACHDNSIPAGLAGDWLWQGTSGGFAGMSYRPEPGKNIILHVATDNHFALYRNDSLLVSGAFQTKQVSSIYSGKNETYLELAEPTVTTAPHSEPVVFRGIVSLTSDHTLTIGDNAYDGFSSTFTRNR